MMYELGEILIVKGIIFKETGLYDTRRNGHPVLIISSTDELFYYLTITSKMGKYNSEAQYYHYIGGQSYNGHTHNGYINYKNIYKREYEFHSVRETVESNTLNNILNNFIYFQEQIKADEYYNEIKDGVKQYVKR